jgi:hypothetical protein
MWTQCRVYTVAMVHMCTTRLKRVRSIVVFLAFCIPESLCLNYMCIIQSGRNGASSFITDVNDAFNVMLRYRPIIFLYRIIDQA